MAIVHISMKASSQAPPAAAHAEYIAREGAYARRSGIELVESGNLPEFAEGDALKFWQAADEHERANGRTYRELQIALPRELSQEGRHELAREAASTWMGDRYAYTLAVHAPLAKDKIEQPHMHLMFSERAVTEDTRGIPEERFFKRNGAKKDREWAQTEKLVDVREQWCEMMNRAMERASLPERMSPLSWEAQGRMDLAELVEPKLPVGETLEAEVVAGQIAYLRKQRAELPPAHLDLSAANTWLEERASVQIGEVEQRLERELGIIEQAIVKVRELIQRAADAVREVFQPATQEITEDERRYVQLRRVIESNETRSFSREDYGFWTEAHRKHGANYDALRAKVEREVNPAALLSGQNGPTPENPWKTLEAQLPLPWTREKLRGYIREALDDGQSELQIQQNLLRWILPNLAKHAQIEDYLHETVEDVRNVQKSRTAGQEYRRDYGPER